MLSVGSKYLRFDLLRHRFDGTAENKICASMDATILATFAGSVFVCCRGTQWRLLILSRHVLLEHRPNFNWSAIYH